MIRLWKIAPSPAMPVAIPICRNVLFVPDAIPARLRLDDADRGRRERRVDEADADAGDEEAGEERRPVESTEMPDISSSATPQSASPPPSRKRTGTRVDSRPEIGATKNESSESGRKITPVFTARVAEHVLEVERQEEELREHPGRDRKGGDLRARERRHPEEADVEHRRLVPQLEEPEGDEKHDRGGEEADDAAARPAPVAAAKQPEDEREQAARQRDEAERSKPPCSSSRDSCSTRSPPATQATPIGRLTKKIQRQPT